MRTFRIIPFIALACSLVFASCNTNEDDTNSPVVTAFQVNGLSFGTIEILAGNNILVTALITEDIAMDSYRVRVVADFTPVSGTPFSFDQTSNSGSLTTTVNETIAVPASAIAGPYKVILTATDAAGRESEMKIAFAITSPTQADINLTSPTPNFTVAFTDTIVLVGTVTDDVDIVSIAIVAEPAQQSGGLVAAGGPFYDGAFNLNGSSDTTWDFAEVQNSAAYVIVPSGITTGSYQLEIRATDSSGNVAIETVPFSVF